MNESLSIAIPSYNRAEQLARTLEAFLPQVMPRQIPINVSYEDRTDQTFALLTEMKKRYPLIRFQTDPKVLGIDRNMAASVRMASSRYVWLFGDDDLPRPGAVDTVLGHLNDGYGLLVVNAASYNSDFTVQVEERRLKIFEDRVYGPADHEKLLVDTASYATFLGGVLVDRDLWNSVSHEAFMGSDYLHVAVAYRYIVGHKALLIAEPLVDLRLGGAVWASRYFQVELIHWPQTIWGLPAQHYSDRAKAKVCARRPTGSIRRLLATRAYGYYGEAEYDRYVKGDDQIPGWKKGLLRAVTCVPRSWAKLALVQFKRLQGLWGRPNLELTRYRLSAPSKAGGKVALIEPVSMRPWP